MAIIAKIAQKAPQYMEPEAYILIEIGASQGPRCLKLFEASGYRNVKILKDYSSRDRILKAQRPI